MRVEILVDALEFVRARLGVAIIAAEEDEVDVAASEIERASDRLIETVEELRA